MQVLQQQVTMKQDIVHIDVPEFDPDIDAPETHRTHHTAIVSVHNLLNLPEPEHTDAINNQEETDFRGAPETTTSDSQITQRNITPAKLYTQYLNYLQHNKKKQTSQSTTTLNTFHN